MHVLIHTCPSGLCQLLHFLENLVAVPKGADANAQQVLVGHVHQDVHGDVLMGKHLHQPVQMDASDKVLHAHVVPRSCSCGEQVQIYPITLLPTPTLLIDSTLHTNF